MKKILYLLFFVGFITFFGLSNVHAASKIDFYLECKYDYSIGAKQSTVGNSITLYYSSMKDSDNNEIGLQAKGDYFYGEGYINDVYLPFGTKDYSTSWFSFAVGKESQPLLTFKSVYASSGQCPKYMYAEFVANSWFTDYYKINFSDTEPAICSSNDAKCKILGKANGTVKKVVYYEGEDKWEYTYDGDNACSKLHLKMYIASNQFVADYENAVGSKYSSISVKKEVVKNVDIEDIYDVAYGKDFTIYVNPNENGSLQTQGVSFGTPIGSTYCSISDGLPDESKTCTTYDSISSTLSTNEQTAKSSASSIDTAASKYLTAGSAASDGSITYTAPSYNDSKDASALMTIADDINTNITSSTFSTAGNTYLTYLQGLSTGGTLCTDDVAKVTAKLSEFATYSTTEGNKIDALKQTLLNIETRLKAMGETDKANKVAGYVSTADAAKAAVVKVSKSAANSMLDGTDFGIGDISGATCNVISTDLQSFLQTIIDYIRIAGIVLAVIFGILDYIKAIFGTDEKSMAKANKNFMTRLIAVALLFLIPSILTFVLGLFNILGLGGSGTCGIN